MTSLARKHLPALVAGALLGAVATLALLHPAGTAAAGSKLGGAALVGSRRETIKYTSLKGDAKADTFDRNVYQVPETYGKLVGLSAGEYIFEDGTGVIRNVLLGQEPGLIAIERSKDR